MKPRSNAGPPSELFRLLALLALIAGCAGPPAQEGPTISSFTATASAVPVGERTQLTAVFSGAGAQGVIDGVGPVESGIPVDTPTLGASTTFHLTVTAEGRNAEAQAVVAVQYRDRIRRLQDSPLARGQHLAVALADGSVLLMGGLSSETPNVPDSDTTQRFDGVSETLAPGPTLAFTAEDRLFTTLAPLPAGDFLLVGGGLNSGFAAGAAPGALSQVYQGATGAFRRVGDTQVDRHGEATPVPLADGTVLLVGGGIPGLASAERFDASTGLWTASASMSLGRRSHTATLLPDGRVLVVGGLVCCSQNSETYTATAELFDPRTGAFRPTGSLRVARAFHQATLLPDGRVLVTGGFAGSATALTALAVTEAYDVASEEFRDGPPLAVARAGHSALVLGDGRVLVVGGLDGSPSAPGIAETELFHPDTNQWTAGPLRDPANLDATATRLGNGKVLLFGGTDVSGDPQPTVLLFD